MMKLMKCIEDDSMHKKVGMLQVSQLIMKMSIRNVVQTTNGLRRGQKRKWDKTPPKDNMILAKKEATRCHQNLMLQVQRIGSLCQGLQKCKARLGTRVIYCKGECGQVGPYLNLR
jgi:coenzyme F420-reducing hydrogenase gamma subunit